MQKESRLDFDQPFSYSSFASITSSGGHIGRFFWDNQSQLSIETWDSSMGPWNGPSTPGHCETSEIPGSSALIATVGDWVAWCERLFW